MIGKLGKLPPRFDSRTLRLADYISGGKLPPPPPRVGWCSKVTGWGMMANDKWGDCTCAGAGHAIYGWTSVAGKPALPTDQQVLDAYSGITGFNPADPDTDQGANELDVLKYWRKTGIAGHKIDAFASIHPASEIEMKESIWFFGNAYLGLALPTRCQDQKIWYVPTQLTPDDEPGSLGGHCTLAVAADESGVTMVTWGGLQRATWAWMAKYCDEAYALLSRDWIESSGMTPGGVLLESLQHDIGKVGRA